MEGLELGREGNNLRFPTWLKMMLTQDYSVSSSVQQSSHFHILSMCRKGESFLGCDLEEKWPKKVAHLFPFLCANPVSHFYEKKNKTAFLQRAAVWSCESGVPYHIGSVITVRKENSPFRVVLPLGEKKKANQIYRKWNEYPKADGWCIFKCILWRVSSFPYHYLSSGQWMWATDWPPVSAQSPGWRGLSPIPSPGGVCVWMLSISARFPWVHVTSWVEFCYETWRWALCVCWWGRAVPEAVLGL